MPVSVSMPQLGESVTEGTVTRWLKKEGERVEADEPLLEVSTDKVDTEIPSPVSGILRGITVAEDETVAVGAELAVIDETADAAPGPAPAEFHLKLVAAAAARLADPLTIVDAQRRELLRQLREAPRAEMDEPDRSPAALLLEGIVLRLQADLHWLEACERHWTGRKD